MYYTQSMGENFKERHHRSKRIAKPKPGSLIYWERGPFPHDTDHEENLLSSDLHNYPHPWISVFSMKP